MSSHTHNYYGPVAQTSGEHSPAQAGERNSQTLNHTECADLSALSPVLMQLLDAIGEVPSPRARERLTEHVQAAQREVAKTDKPDPGRIKAALDAIKSGADVLENSGKIIGLCNKAYQFLASFLGLPPSPLP